MKTGKLEREASISIQPQRTRLRTHVAGVLNTRAISNMILVPKTLDIDEFINKKGKGLVVVAYCIKPATCPEGRFSLGCRLNCSLCDVSRIQIESQEADFDFVIATDHRGFFKFMKSNEDRYERLIAITCPYTVAQIAYRVHRTFGVSGLVFLLKGNVCTSKERYMKGAIGKKADQTMMDLETFLEVMKRIKRISKSRTRIDEFLKRQVNV